MSKYFVSVFVGGKCATLFYSEDLCQIHVCRLLYKGCEIEVFDIEDMCFVPSSTVSAVELLTKQKIRSDLMPQHVVCVDTKEIYNSISDCAKRIGVTLGEIATAIQSLKTIDGRRYLFESDLKPLDCE